MDFSLCLFLIISRSSSDVSPGNNFLRDGLTKGSLGGSAACASGGISDGCASLLLMFVFGNGLSGLECPSNLRILPICSKLSSGLG